MEINCNSGDSYLIYTETEVSGDFDMTIEIEKLLTNPLPSDWLTLKIDIQPVLKNRLMILGASDSGKTTLIKFLALNLPKPKEKIGLIDLDVGQNSLGLPGTINLSEFTINGIEQKYTEFFGHISPAGNKNIFLQIVQTFFNNIQSLFEYSWLIIDTSGYIQTPEALEIKRGLLAIIKPQLVLLLGLGAQELKNKLLFRNITFMNVPSAIEGIKKEKSPEMRKRKRYERFNEYFNEKLTLDCSIERIASIQVNYDNEINVLASNEGIKFFIQNNKEKLENVLIEIASIVDKTKIFAKILDITTEKIIIVASAKSIVPERFRITIGSIYLDFI